MKLKCETCNAYFYISDDIIDEYRQCAYKINEVFRRLHLKQQKQQYISGLWQILEEHHRKHCRYPDIWSA